VFSPGELPGLAAVGADDPDLAPVLGLLPLHERLPHHVGHQGPVGGEGRALDGPVLHAQGRGPGEGVGWDSG
jgi:hypothetical protein